MEGLESFLTSGQQMNIFLLSVLFGIPVGIFAGALRVFRLAVPHGRIAVFFEDVLFFLVYGVFLLCFSIAFARSEFRFFYILGNVVGAGLYLATVGKFAERLFLFALGGVKKAVKKFVLICEKIKAKFSGTVQKMDNGEKNDV